MDVDDLEEATEDVLVHSIADAVDDECDMISIPRVTSVEELIVDRCYIAYLSNLLVLATTPIRKTCLTYASGFITDWHRHSSDMGKLMQCFQQLYTVC